MIRAIELSDLFDKVTYESISFVKDEKNDQVYSNLVLVAKENCQVPIKMACGGFLANVMKIKFSYQDKDQKHWYMIAEDQSITVWNDEDKKWQKTDYEHDRQKEAQILVRNLSKGERATVVIDCDVQISGSFSAWRIGVRGNSSLGDYFSNAPTPQETLCTYTERKCSHSRCRRV
jgi:hypothetical protein